MAMPLDDTGFRDRIGPLDKIDRVIDLLATEDRWCKGMLVTRDGRRCIMGALQAVHGTDALIRPIALAIRQVTARDFGRIERFNDDPATTHALVLQVLSQARENLVTGVELSFDEITSQSTRNWWKASLERLSALLATH
jgi:hypothetical protein